MGLVGWLRGRTIRVSMHGSWKGPYGRVLVALFVVYGEDPQDELGG